MCEEDAVVNEVQIHVHVPVNLRDGRAGPLHQQTIAANTKSDLMQFPRVRKRSSLAKPVRGDWWTSSCSVLILEAPACCFGSKCLRSRGLHIEGCATVSGC